MITLHLRLPQGTNLPLQEHSLIYNCHKMISLLFPETKPPYLYSIGLTEVQTESLTNLSTKVTLIYFLTPIPTNSFYLVVTLSE